MNQNELADCSVGAMILHGSLTSRMDLAPSSPVQEVDSPRTDKEEARMAESERRSDKSGTSPRPPDEEYPIRHPSQAEGERGTGQPPEPSEEQASASDEEVDARPRPSQAEGERDE